MKDERFPELYEDHDINLKIGLVDSIDTTKNIAYVVYSFIGTPVEAKMNQVFPNIGDQSSSTPEDYKHYAWGVFGTISKNSLVLTATIQNGLTYIITTLPPSTADLISNWRNESKLKMNRLPIKDDDKRDDKLDDDILKWGELFFRSSGLADIFIDYIGRILLESPKQITFKIGDRDDDNKITSPELTVSFGRIVDDDGEELTDVDDKKVKVQIKSATKTLVSINEDNNINIGDGAKGSARKDDEIKSTSSEDSTYWTWLSGLVNILMTWTVVPADGGAALKAAVVAYIATSPVPSSLTGKITKASSTVKVGGSSE